VKEYFGRNRFYVSVVFFFLLFVPAGWCSYIVVEGLHPAQDFAVTVWFPSGTELMNSHNGRLAWPDRLALEGTVLYYPWHEYEKLRTNEPQQLVIVSDAVGFYFMKQNGRTYATRIEYLGRPIIKDMHRGRETITDFKTTDAGKQLLIHQEPNQEKVGSMALALLSIVAIVSAVMPCILWYYLSYWDPTLPPALRAATV
jgi:hypothetical protein